MTRVFFLLISILCFTACSGLGDVQSDSKPISHATWNVLLKKHVDQKGMVNYQGMLKDSLELNEYLNLLRENHPNEENWSVDERLAYWINAYNAFTVRLIIRNYPVKSIKDIAGKIPFVNTPWDIQFIQIEDETYDLNNLEHGIIRKEFDEPRIHFVLVCAAMSCPKLRNEAFTAEKLEAQLEEEAIYFFNNPAKNEISTEKIKISKLLDWYWGDFKGIAKSRVEYVNRYSTTKVNVDAEVDFMDYQWELNEQ